MERPSENSSERERPMYDLTPATTQANSVQEIGIRLRQLFLFFYATASATGPVNIVAQGMKQPFMHRVNRASVKKLNALQISTYLNALVIMSKLSEHRIRNLEQALTFILPLISLEEEHVYLTASVLICDQWVGGQSLALIDCVSPMSKLVSADYKTATLLYEKLQTARLV
jgi:hypothetical protein